MAAQLDISSSDSDPSLLIVSGELDTHTAPTLARALEGIEPDRSIRLDLSATSFISSAGLSAILNAHRRHVDGGGSLVVTAADPNVARTIELSGLTELLGLPD